MNFHLCEVITWRNIIIRFSDWPYQVCFCFWWVFIKYELGWTDCWLVFNVCGLWTIRVFVFLCRCLTGSLVNWYVYLHEWLMFKVNVGIPYTIHIHTSYGCDRWVPSCYGWTKFWATHATHRGVDPYGKLPNFPRVHTSGSLVSKIFRCFLEDWGPTDSQFGRVFNMFLKEFSHQKTRTQWGFLGYDPLFECSIFS